MTARILVVEDAPTQAEMARSLLGALGHDVRIVPTGALARTTAMDWVPDAVLLDIELPDGSGLALLRAWREAPAPPAVIVVTANGSINAAVEAMRAGAEDFIVKPYARTRLEVTLGNALEKRALAIALRDARAQLTRERFHGFIGASRAMQAAYRTIESVAASRASVFITGESGTGKELAAEAVHRTSPRARGPFIALNCAAIPRDLLESEVFGHVRGAFTGATSDRVGAARLADGGTLFLDEIAEMPPEMQGKLLRFVQTGIVQPVGSTKGERVDVRFVCATHRDPRREVEAGRFREDLYYRLYVVPLELPPLREREGDVLLIARHLLETFAREEGKTFDGFDATAEAALTHYAWPGNVRQLQNVMRNVVVLNSGGTVTAAMLPPMPPPSGSGPPPVLAADPGGALFAPSVDDGEIVPLAVMERRLIEAALRRTRNDVPRAAAMLRVNPSTLYRKLQAWRSEQPLTA